MHVFHTTAKLFLCLDLAVVCVSMLLSRLQETGITEPSSQFKRALAALT